MIDKIWNGCPNCGQGKYPPKAYVCPQCHVKFNTEYDIITDDDDKKGHPSYNMGTADSQGSELI